jgi:hypothetical protein
VTACFFTYFVRMMPWQRRTCTQLISLSRSPQRGYAIQVILESVGCELSGDWRIFREVSSCCGLSLRRKYPYRASPIQEALCLYHCDPRPCPYMFFSRHSVTAPLAPRVRGEEV